MHDAHIGDQAELYVVGGLDAADVAAFEEHIAVCAACLRRVGEAEETVLALERENLVEIVPAMLERRLLLPARARTPFAAFGAAVAAGLVVGILATLLAFSLRTNDTQPAVLAMIHSHFNHAQFAMAASGAPASAKVIFARDRSWLYVIADGSERYGVYLVNGTTSQRLGELQPKGATSSLFVNFTFSEGTIELRDGTTVVERAKI